MKLVTASDLMKCDLAALMVDDSVSMAIRLLHRRRLSGVPVVDTFWRLKGFFSQFEVIRLVMPTPLEVLGQETFLFDDQRALSRRYALIADDPVEKHMNPSPLWVEPTTPLMTVAELLFHNRIRRLPVVKDGLLVGSIDQDDLCTYFATAQEEER